MIPDLRSHPIIDDSRTNLVTFVDRLFNPPSTAEPPPTLGTRTLAARRGAVDLVALPTQQDIDDPRTTEALTALAVAAHVLASFREQWTGQPATARSCYADAQKMQSAFVRTYRRVATSAARRTT
jgi:hypothetical protein